MSSSRMGVRVRVGEVGDCTHPKNVVSVTWPLRPGPRACPEDSPPHGTALRLPCRFCGAWRISGRSTRSCTEVRGRAPRGREGLTATRSVHTAGSAPRCEAIQHPRQLPRGDQAVRLWGERAAHRLHGQLLRGDAVLHVCESFQRPPHRHPDPHQLFPVFQKLFQKPALPCSIVSFAGFVLSFAFLVSIIFSSGFLSLWRHRPGSCPLGESSQLISEPID